MATSRVTDDDRKQANLRLLQRTCGEPFIDILQTATHVVLYEYKSGWTKSGVEGSLFLAQASTAFFLVIINRHSVDNFSVPVAHNNMQLQHQDPYLIFRQKQSDGTSRIRGIWFHNPQERASMAQVLQETITALKAAAAAVAGPPSLPPPPPAAPAAPVQQQHQSTISYAPPVVATTATTASVVVAAMSSPPPRPISAPPARHHQTPQQAYQTQFSTCPPTPPMPASHIRATTPTLPEDAAASFLTNLTMSPAVVASSARQTTTPIQLLPPTNNNEQQQQPAAAGGAAPLLDKKSLQLALLSLVQDDRFLDLLHSQYLRVVNARAKKQQQPR